MFKLTALVALGTALSLVPTSLALDDTLLVESTFRDGKGSLKLDNDWPEPLCGRNLYFQLPDAGKSGYSYTVDAAQALDESHDFQQVAQQQLIFDKGLYWLDPHADTKFLHFQIRKGNTDEVLWQKADWVEYQASCEGVEGR